MPDKKSNHFLKKYNLPTVGVIFGLIISMFIRIKRGQFKLASQLFLLILNIKKPVQYFTNNNQIKEQTN